MADVIDITGQKFGHLTVRHRGENDRHRKARWWCECDCGNPELILVIGSNLKKGNTTSCGCIGREKLIRRNMSGKKYNTYDLTGEYGIGWTSNTNKEFYFDIDDYDKIKDYCWLEGAYGYIKTNMTLQDGSRKYASLHQTIMNANGIIIDHKNGNKYDNRKSNLRLCTQGQNNMNRSIPDNHAIGVAGVYFRSDNNKYVASISKNKQRIHLGCFDNLEDAIRVRKKAEEEYFGEWSYANSRTEVI